MKSLFYPILIFLLIFFLACDRRTDCLTTEKNTYKVNEEVQFINCSKHRKKNEIARWEFGDGGCQEAKGSANVLHRYLNAGVFEVVLSYGSAGGGSPYWRESIFITVG